MFKKCFSKNTLSRFVPAVFDSLLRPKRLARQRNYTSVVPEATLKARLRALEGRHVSSKSGSETETRELQGGTKEKKVFPP